MDPSNNAAFIEAVLNGQLEIVKELVGNGQDVNVRDSKGKPALMITIATLNWHLAEFLLQNGANVNMCDARGKSPLSLACRFREGYDLAKLLISYGAHINGSEHCAPLLDALRNNEKAFQLLLKSRANPNVQCPDTGDTALHIAVYKNNLDLVKTLIASGANINVRANSGRTALHQACWAKTAGIELLKLLIETLLRQGRGLNHKDRWGKTALDYASSDPNSSKAWLLLTNGASINNRAVNELSRKINSGWRENESAEELLLKLDYVGLCRFDKKPIYDEDYIQEDARKLEQKIISTKSFTWLDVLTSNDTGHLIYSLRAMDKKLSYSFDECYAHLLKIKLYQDVARDRLLGRATTRLRCYYTKMVQQHRHYLPIEVIMKILSHLSNEDLEIFIGTNERFEEIRLCNEFYDEKSIIRGVDSLGRCEDHMWGAVD